MAKFVGVVDSANILKTIKETFSEAWDAGAMAYIGLYWFHPISVRYPWGSSKDPLPKGKGSNSISYAFIITYDVCGTNLSGCNEVYKDTDGTYDLLGYEYDLSDNSTVKLNYKQWSYKTDHCSMQARIKASNTDEVNIRIIDSELIHAETAINRYLAWYLDPHNTAVSAEDYEKAITSIDGNPWISRSI